jgi:hypothetical protein
MAVEEPTKPNQAVLLGFGNIFSFGHNFGVFHDVDMFMFKIVNDLMIVF